MSIDEQPDTSAGARRQRELVILHTIAATLNTVSDLGEALRVTLTQVTELFDLNTGWVWLLREDDEEPYLAASLSLPPALARHPQRMEGWCYCLDTFVEGDMAGAANINVVTCSRLKGLVDGANGLRYHASVPLYANGKQLGVMNVASPDWRELSPDDLRLLHTIGDMLGVAIERARLFARSAELGAAEERNRLAREIHDTLAQGMAGVALQLESADALLDGQAPGPSPIPGEGSAADAETPSRPTPSVRSPGTGEGNAQPEGQARVEAAQRAVQRALQLTRATLEEARRSVLDLRAAPLEGRSLAAALAALARDESARSGLDIRLRVTGGAHPLPSRVEVGLYRIAQEALANIVRHAQATRVIIKLTIDARRVICVITDDGQGFDVNAIAPGRYGLIGLNERAKLLGGAATIASAPGKGSRLRVVVPLGASGEAAME